MTLFQYFFDGFLPMKTIQAPFLRYCCRSKQSLHTNLPWYECSQFESMNIWSSLNHQDCQKQNFRHGEEPSSLDYPNYTGIRHADHQKLLAGTSQVLYPSHECARCYKLADPASWMACQDGVWRTHYMFRVEIENQYLPPIRATKFVGDKQLSGIYSCKKKMTSRYTCHVHQIHGILIKRRL